MNPNQPLPPGHVLGSYRIERLVAEGGTMARVYEATGSDGERYAVKVLPVAQGVDPALLLRFEREAQVLLKLRHPNIPQLLAQGEAGALRYLVFEYFEHATLAEVIEERGSLGVDGVVELLRACGSALAAVHEQGVLHRDVKPTNILVVKDGPIQLIDFGLALVADTAQLTQSDAVVGTYGYVAPEALLGDRAALTGTTDIYALGCVAFEALTGRPPFVEKVLSALLEAHMERQPPDPRSILPETPDPLADLLSRMLRKIPSLRPDATGLLEALEAVPVSS